MKKTYFRYFQFKTPKLYFQGVSNDGFIGGDTINAVRVSGENSYRVNTANIDFGGFLDSGEYAPSKFLKIGRTFEILSITLEEKKFNSSPNPLSLIKIEYLNLSNQNFQTAKPYTVNFVHSSKDYRALAHSILEVLSVLFPFISHNTTSLVDKKFMPNPLSINSFKPKMIDYIFKLDSFKCVKIETSVYRAARENRFYEHIKLDFVRVIDNYFKVLLSMFCNKKRNDSGKWNGNTFIYLDGTDLAWQPDHDGITTEYDWKLEKAEFIVFLFENFDENECLLNNLLESDI